MTPHIIAGMTVALVVTTAGWAVTFDKLKDERTEHIKTKAQHELVVEGFKQAQAEADRKAKAKAEELKKEAQRNAEQADARYDDLYGKYRASLLRFQATQGGSVGANRSELPAAEGGNGPGGSPELSEGLIISVHDAEICAVNTARLQVVRDWAIKLE